MQNNQLSNAHVIKLGGSLIYPKGGMDNAPFDPIAAKLASELGIRVLYLNGADLENAEKALNGELFVGTVIDGNALQ